MSVEDFKKLVIGSISDEKKALLDKLDFNKDGVISLKSLIKELPKDKELYKKAADISKLQPIQAGGGKGFGLLLDIDVFSTEPFDLRDDLLTQRLIEMRWLKNKVFFGSITEQALKSFQ